MVFKRKNCSYIIFVSGSREQIDGLVELSFISSDMDVIDKKLQLLEMKVILRSKTDLEVMSLTLETFEQAELY